MSQRKISRDYGVSPKTVRDIIRQEGGCPEVVRKDKIRLDPDKLEELYNKCDGYMQRVHEKLVEEEGIEVGYSTLTRLVRELDITGRRTERCARVPDEAGQEMQHDTSEYKVYLGDHRLRVIASVLYYRYSKQRYLKFYRSFNRFRMKCFLHEALSYYGYSARECIIDNTSLARLRGTGKNAVISPEMEAFARQYGFRFICHEVGHSDRKAGNERSFYTVESNFLSGREFSSLEDLNHQALEWATLRMANRPLTKARIIPSQMFEHEKPFLTKLFPYIPPPYLEHHRNVDQYGYAAFDGNYYWVPGEGLGEVIVLQYSERLKIYRKRELLVEYPLPPYGIKNQTFSPAGRAKPNHKPHNRKRPSEQKEKRLRSMASEIDSWISFAMPLSGKQKHSFVRELFRLSQKVDKDILIQGVVRAHKYRITDLSTLERIIMLQITDSQYELPLVDIDEDFKDRSSYQEGQLSDAPNLSLYESLDDDEAEDE